MPERPDCAICRSLFRRLFRGPFRVRVRFRAPFRALFCCLAALACHPAGAGAIRADWGNDPFLAISHAVPGCAEALGPRLTRAEWLHQAHYRVERGNSCWNEGRCRLSNAYQYDREIAEAVTRRLANIEPALHWRERSTLWLTLQRRFIYVAGCVAPGFDTASFLKELAKTADVERVIDQTTVNPAATPLPYRTLAHPDAMPADPAP